MLDDKVLLGALGLLCILILPGLAIARNVGRFDRSLDSAPEWRLARGLTGGLSVLTIGSQLLVRWTDLSEQSAWTFAIGAACLSIVGMVLPRSFPRIRLRGGELAGVVASLLAIAGAASPQLALIVARPDALIAPTPWYYWWQTTMTIRLGALPVMVSEWGTAAPFLADYPGFTSASATVAVLTGNPELLFGAQIVRVLSILCSGIGFWLLARAWGAGRVAATGGTMVLFSLATFAVKLASFRPEAMGYGLMFLVPTLAKRFLQDRNKPDLVLAAVGFVALAQIHGLVLVIAGMLVVGTAAGHTLIGHGKGKAALATSLILGLTIGSIWIAGDAALKGRFSDAGKLASAPTLGTDGTDPTWVFAAAGTRREGNAPPSAARLSLESIQRGVIGQGDTPYRVVVGLVAGALMTAALVGYVEPRRLVVLVLTTATLLAGMSILFQMGWDTYVPRRTVGGRLVQLTVLLVPLAGSMVADSIRAKGWRMMSQIVWIGLALWLWMASINGIGRLEAQTPPPTALNSLRELTFNSDDLILANAYTEGYLPLIAGADGLLDGRAPYTDADLLNRANNLVANARRFLTSTDTLTFDPRDEGVTHVLLSRENWILGTSRTYEFNLDALLALEWLEVVVDTPDYILMEVTSFID